MERLYGQRFWAFNGVLVLLFRNGHTSINFNLIFIQKLSLKLSLLSYHPECNDPQIISRFIHIFNCVNSNILPLICWKWTSNRISPIWWLQKQSIQNWLSSKMPVDWWHLIFVSKQLIPTQHNKTWDLVSWHIRDITNWFKMCYRK